MNTMREETWVATFVLTTSIVAVRLKPGMPRKPRAAAFSHLYVLDQ